MANQHRRFLRLPAVKYQVGLGRSAIYAGVKAGTFPRPYKLSENGRAVAWDSLQVDEWCESRIKAGC